MTYEYNGTKYDTDDAAIMAAINEIHEKVGKEFGLRAFPGETFFLSVGSSYYSFREGVMLYTYIRKGDKFESFCKGTPAELKRQVVKL